MGMEGDWHIESMHRKEIWLFAVLCLVGIVLRLFYLGHLSLWGDEDSSLTASREPLYWAAGSQ